MPTKNQIAGKLKFYSKPYGRQWKWRYQVHGSIVEPQLQIPPALANVDIIDPLTPVKKELPKWTPSRRHPLLEGFFPPMTLKDHPHYHDKPIKLFDKNIKFHAGLDQVCLLTKSKPISGLPINYAANRNQISNKDDLVKDYIRQAMAFNPTKEFCRGFRIPHDPKFEIGDEYATSHSRQMRIMLDNMIRLINVNINRKNPALIGERRLVENAPFLTNVQRADEFIQIRRNNDFVVLSKRKPAPVASASDVEETRAYKFIDMYPVYPTIDLKEENIYNLSDKPQLGVALSQLTRQQQHIHTVFNINENSLTNQENLCSLVMFAFGVAYAQAQMLNNQNRLAMDEARTLKDPIVVKAVSMSHDKLNYVLFQLNTLSYVDNAGIKNLAYFDTNNELYANRPSVSELPYPTHKNLQRYALSHLEFKPEAFDKLHALIAHDTSLP